MKHKTLVTIAATGMLAFPGVAALAADWSIQQLQVSDGYNAVTTYSPPPERGAAGRPGRLAAEDVWLDQQIKITDGYAETSGASRSDMQPR